jgi:predicted Zn-dependent protease
MKQKIILSIILLLGTAAIIAGERRKVDVSAGPSALLYLIADTEQELTRMPVTFTKMSDQEEIQIGDSLAQSYELQKEVKNDPDVIAIETYLVHVGSRLEERAHRHLPYKFHYIPDEGFINAFALPGGHVYVGSGLLAMMDSEDELASVIGHEIEHIDHYHCAERMQQERALRKIPFGGLLSLPIEVFEAGYSKDQELEADREGTRLSVESGYSAGGAIRMFETFQRLYEEYQVRPKTPQDELSRVMAETLEGYFRSHPQPAERIAQIKKMIASESWPPHAEKDLAIAYIFRTNQAAHALDSGHFSQAQQLATRSLQLSPAQPKALGVLARAQFSQADFAQAATTYRRLLDTKMSTDDGYSYAEALAAADRRSAAAEFGGWMTTIKGDAASDLQIPLAGLALLSGDGALAKALAGKAQSNQGQDWAPKWLGRLSWWYYLAGDYVTALDLIKQAIQLNPGSVNLTIQRAWIDIEGRKLEDASETLQSTYDSGSLRKDKRMAQAVVYWLSHQSDSAISDFENARNDQPEWNNPRWVQALYSPMVAQSVQEMRDEVERRRKLKQNASR